MKNISRVEGSRNRRLAITLVALAIACIALISSSHLPKVHAAGDPTFTGGSPVNGVIGSPTNITDLQITGTGNPNVPVTLRVTHGTLHMTTETGLTFTSGDPASTLAFSGSLVDVNNALATLQYTRSDPGTDTLESTLVGSDQVYDPTTGHLYQFVDANVTWNDAFAAASTYTYQGLTGYLATVTSSEENDYLTARLPNGGWIGASDAAVEGQWKWVDGPENGTLFYTGNGGLGTGLQVPGQYSNWNGGEPNNSGNNENCAQFLSGSTGYWNDLQCDAETLPYVVEFGGPGSLPSVSFKDLAITTTAPSITVADCAQLKALDSTPGNQYASITLTQDIDCTGYTVDPLFSSSGFVGTFDGQGHTISHLDYEHQSDGNVGLFSYTNNGAVIKNLKLKDGIIKGYYFVGAVVGESSGSLTISNVSSNLNISSDCSEYCGGLVGDIYVQDGQTATIENTNNTGENDGAYDSGGIIGYIETSGGTVNINQVSNTGALLNNNSSNDYAGGIIGAIYAYSGSGPSQITINNVYNQGNIIQPNNQGIGGLIGDIEGNDGGPSAATNVTLENAYNSGDVSGISQVGGLIGFNQSAGDNNFIETLQNTFNTGSLTSGDPTTAGTVIGDDRVDNSTQHIISSNNYYDATADNGFTCSPVNTIDACYFIDTSSQPNYFKANHLNQPMHSWNFSSIWKTNYNGYPTFGYGSDTDGIADSVENAAPNNGDANGDGIPDSQQDNVASFVDTSSGKYAVLDVPDNCSIHAVNTSNETSNTIQDSGFNYPLGLMNFTINCNSVGSTVSISQYYYGAGSNFVLRKFNPSTNAYFTINNAQVTNVNINGQSAVKVTYQVTDGGTLDNDGLANGVIIDPVGLGVVDVSSPNTGLSPMR